MVSEDRRDALRVFTRHPDSRVLFEYLEPQLRRANDLNALVDLIRRHLPWEQSAGQKKLLQSLIGLELKRGELDGARDAANALLKIDPSSLAALFARQRIDNLELEQASVSSELADALHSSRGKAEVKIVQAQHAERQGRTAVAAGLVEEAARIAPDHAPLAMAHLDRLEATGDWLGASIQLQRMLETHTVEQDEDVLVVRLVDILCDRLGRPDDALDVLGPLLGPSSPVEHFYVLRRRANSWEILVGPTIFMHRPLRMAKKATIPPSLKHGQPAYDNVEPSRARLRL